MIPAYELAMAKRQTQAFINADVESIVIEPRVERVSDGAGGWVEQPGAPLPPISVRLIPQSDAVPAAAALEGSRPTPDFVLVAMPDADIQRYDRFSWRDKVWDIEYVHEKPEYEFKADVVVHAG